MNNRYKNPKKVLQITRYEDLEDYAISFAEGHLGLLMVVGRPGTAKTKTIEQAVGDRAFWLQGNVSPVTAYCDLYDHRGKPVVLDDADTLNKDVSGISLLKCLCQTNVRKTVDWRKESPVLQRREVPQSFVTTSKVAIIANEWKSLDANISAVHDRGHYLEFDPSAIEVHRKTAEWFRDQEIFDFIGAHLYVIRSPSMRDYVKAAEVKQTNRIDWKEHLLRQWATNKTALVLSLIHDASFDNENERAKAFAERGGGGRSTYFNVKRRLVDLLAEQQLEAIDLKASSVARRRVQTLMQEGTIEKVPIAS